MNQNAVQKINNRLVPLICPGIFLLIWEMVGHYRLELNPLLISMGCRADRVPDFSFLLPVSNIAPAFYRLFLSGEILPYLWATTWRSGIAFLLAALIGVAAGVPLGLSKRTERLLIPSVDAARTVPPVALLPVLILFFGIDDPMKIVFIFVGGVWPVILNSARAVKSVDPMYIKVAFNSGHDSLAVLRRVVIPASLPGIFTGLKVSLSICVILSIVSEMMVGNTGLGFFLNYAKRNLEYDTMFATIFVIAILGWILNGLVNELDRRVLFWYYQSRDVQMEHHNTWKF